ncbi:MAG TPA: hypothetical protein VFS44_01970 [Gemmatimonadaceae bacterium]|nr:hypothetical protein [Gemmatimonadaceae bacterium]
MLHLDPERLAALADDEPTPAETAHLASCAECERERAAHRELLMLAAAERSAMLARPLTDWGTLSARLHEEGLVRETGAAGASRSRFRMRPWMRAAAAVLIALGGVAVGRATAGMSLGGYVPVGDGGTSVAVRDGDSTHAFVSLSDAMDMMRRSERDYRLAAAYVAAHDSGSASRGGVDVYRARLAALDRVSDAALEAVNEAPADPVINQYLLSARTARAVTLQQLNNSLPAGVTLTSY